MFKVQPLSQTDPRWKDKPLGTDNSSTIGKYGCLLTCMTMVANGYGFQETPDTLNEKMKSMRGFQGAMVIPGALPAALPGMRYKKYQPCENYPAPMDEINATLVTGKPVIVMVDYSPAVGVQNHWIVLVDRKGSDYVIQDPYPYPAETKEVLLTKRYGFAGSPQNIIQAALWLEGDVEQPPQPKPTPKPIPTSGFAVYASVDALALRTQPVVAEDTLIKRLNIHAKLFVSEDVASAKPKIGQQGEWLKVIDADEGYEGYVAAWYVSPEATPQPPAPKPPIPAPPAPVTPTPQPPDQAPADILIVYAMTEGLAFRSQPVVAGNTLIKRVPVNSQFLSLEPVGKASTKLGVINQWLNVKDVEGVLGYVAAWFVSQYRQDILGVTDTPVTIPTPGSAPTKLVVRAAEENLALRKQPLISDTTLIKRYPLISEFLVLESVDQAQAKIGVTNQWLHVRALDGQEGYLAAWYVVIRPAVRV
jgi:hypothetical protein